MPNPFTPTRHALSQSKCLALHNSSFHAAQQRSPPNSPARLSHCCQMLQPQLLTDTLRQLSADTWGFISNPVAVLHAPVDPCTFLRQYVATNQPALIQGATDHWPAAGLWDRQYLDSRVGAHEVSVELTPNGFGDAVTDYETDTGETAQCFCMPHTSRMPFREFTDLFFRSKQQQQQQGQQGSVIPYLSQQNSNLTRELPQLLADVEPQLGFAAAAFAAEPDAVNVWIGDERAATTFHKDHYENIYCVLRGKKVFHLLPPTELYRMGLRRYPAARFEPQDDGELKPVLLQPASSVLWSPVHPEGPTAADTQLYFDSSLPKPLRVEVNAGEVLYLPAMWWHYVEQAACEEQGWGVAVNYWYDMQFDSRYAAYTMVESLAQQVGLVPGKEEEEEVPADDAVQDP